MFCAEMGAENREIACVAARLGLSSHAATPPTNLPLPMPTASHPCMPAPCLPPYMCSCKACRSCMMRSCSGWQATRGKQRQKGWGPGRQRQQMQQQGWAGSFQAGVQQLESVYPMILIFGCCTRSAAKCIRQRARSRSQRKQMAACIEEWDGVQVPEHRHINHQFAQTPARLCIEGIYIARAGSLQERSRKVQHAQGWPVVKSQL